MQSAATDILSTARKLRDAQTQIAKQFLSEHPLSKDESQTNEPPKDEPRRGEPPKASPAFVKALSSHTNDLWLLADSVRYDMRLSRHALRRLHSLEFAGQRWEKDGYRMHMSIVQGLATYEEKFRGWHNGVMTELDAVIAEYSSLRWMHFVIPIASSLACIMLVGTLALDKLIESMSGSRAIMSPIRSEGDHVPITRIVELHVLSQDKSVRVEDALYATEEAITDAVREALDNSPWKFVKQSENVRQYQRRPEPLRFFQSVVVDSPLLVEFHELPRPLICDDASCIKLFDTDEIIALAAGPIADWKPFTSSGGGYEMPFRRGAALTTHVPLVLKSTLTSPHTILWKIGGVVVMILGALIAAWKVCGVQVYTWFTRRRRKRSDRELWKRLGPGYVRINSHFEE